MSSEQYQLHRTSQVEDTSLVKEWLKKRQITVVSDRCLDITTNPLDRLSVFLGANYSRLAILHKVIAGRYKRTSYDPFYFSLAPFDKKTVEVVLEYCDRIKSYAFARFIYNQADQMIYFTPCDNEQARNFFSNGHWYERYVHHKISERLDASSKKYASLLNARIQFSNDTSSELDAFYLVGTQPFWVECKTGDLDGNKIDRYHSLCKALGVPGQQALIVFLDKPLEEVNDLAALHNLNMANRTNFLIKLEEALNQLTRKEAEVKALPALTPVSKPPVSSLQPAISKPAPASTPQTKTNSAPTSSASSNSELYALLVAKQLDPLREHRQNLIKALIDLVKPQSTISVVDIRTRLGGSVSLKAPKVQNFLNALGQKGGLLSKDGKPIASNNLKDIVANLASFKLAELENYCVEAYAEALVAAIPGYFSKGVNREEFKKVVGAAVPDRFWKPSLTVIR